MENILIEQQKFFTEQLNQALRLKRYVYWVESNKGEIGEYSTRFEANRAINNFHKLNPKLEFKIIAYEANSCPVCNRLTRRDMIEDFGHCLYCEEHQHE